MNTGLRYLCLLVLAATFLAGLKLGSSDSFSFRPEHYVSAGWAIGGVLVFWILPGISFLWAIAVLASKALKKEKAKIAFRILCMIAVIFLGVLFSGAVDDLVYIALVFGLPFVVFNLGATFGFVATLPEEKRG